MPGAARWSARVGPFAAGRTISARAVVIPSATTAVMITWVFAGQAARDQVGVYGADQFDDDPLGLPGGQVVVG